MVESLSTDANRGPHTETNAQVFFHQAHVLAQFGSQFLQRLFLVFADGLQLKVFVLESMELLDGQQSGRSISSEPGDPRHRLCLALYLFQRADLQGLRAELSHRVFLSVQVTL